jgi:adenine-specific DNA-methyltransferase
MQYRLSTEETFENLSLFARKKLLGRFDTPRPIAQAMTDWAVRSASETILEPSVGGGVFLRSALARLTSLGSSTPLNQLFACDIDSSPCAEAIAIGVPSKQIHNGDFLEFSPQRKFSAVIGNPPYVSLRRTEEEKRAAYFARGVEAGYQEKKGSLWAYFVIKAHSCLGPGGRLAFLLPEAVLYTTYGRNLLDWAAQRFSKCSLISIRERCFVSEGTKERVVIVLFDGCGGPPSDGVAINEFATVKAALAFVSEMDPRANPTGERINGHVIPQAISANAHDIYEELESSGGTTLLGDLAKINIGVVTGANSFFLMTEEERVAKGIRKSSLLPCLTKYGDCSSSFQFSKTGWEQSLIKGKRAWLFCPPSETRDKASLAHLTTFPEDLIETNKTFTKRALWYRPIVPPTPDAFLRYMGEDGPKMALNEAEGTSTNTIHHILFKSAIPRYRKRAIALAIQSTISQLSAEFVGRSYGSGVLKLEPSDCRKLLIPSPICSPQEINKLWDQCIVLRRDGQQALITAMIDAWIYRNWDGEAPPKLQIVKGLLSEARMRRKG